MKKNDVISWLLCCLLLAALGLAVYEATTRSSLETENASLQQQLEQAQTAEKPAITGAPINFADLPNGSYSKMENDDCFAFVQRDSCNPFEREVLAVSSRENIPERFAVVKIQKQVENFLKENPPAK